MYLLLRHLVSEDVLGKEMIFEKRFLLNNFMLEKDLGKWFYGKDFD